MNKLFTSYLLLLCLLTGQTLSAQTQIQMPMPGQTGTFTGNVRGYYFVAPTCFTLTGAMVPTDANSGNQSIAIVRFYDTPPTYSATTNSFTLLYLTQNDTTQGVLPMSIQVEQGDIIGVLGQRSNVCSYSSAGNTTTIDGFSVPLTRLGMQYSLTSTAPQDLWTESAANISRVNLYYDTLLTYGFAANQINQTDYTFSNGADTSFVNTWNYGDGSPLDTTATPAHTYNSPGTYNVCSYITTTCGTDTICGSINVCFPTTISQSVSICNGTSYFIGSSTYTTDGNYEDTLVSAFGCDSIVQTALTILPNSSMIQDISFCQGDSLVVGSNSYFVSGTYYDTLVSANGCDSMVISNLTVLIPSNQTQTISLCDGEVFDYNGHTYTSTGIYYDTLVNVAGCDSIMTTDLTINNAIPTTVQVNGITLTATAGYQYQWINCPAGTAVAGATSQAFTPTQNGQYAVILSEGNCSDTSSCTTISTIGLGENWLQQLSVYPNPVQHELTIELNDNQAAIVIRDVYGNTVYEANHSGTAHVNTSRLAKGIYFLVIRTASGNEHVKEIVKQ